MACNLTSAKNQYNWCTEMTEVTEKGLLPARWKQAQAVVTGVACVALYDRSSFTVQVFSQHCCEVYVGWKGGCEKL